MAILCDTDFLGWFPHDSYRADKSGTRMTDLGRIVFILGSAL
jgi:hypothetical protein